MKSPGTLLLATALAGILPSGICTAADTYTNFVRQKQVPTGVTWDMPVASKGTSVSPLPLDLAGSRFELWTVKSGSAPQSYLLDNAFVGTYAPSGTVAITTEDVEAAPPRTRADRPFEVVITVDGLQNSVTAPAGARSVKLLRHAQSYGAKGNGENIDRGQAVLVSQAVIESNGTIRLPYPGNSVPGGDRAKVRGEERFSLYSVDTNEQIASKTVKIWPVADGSIAGITAGEVFRFKMPPLTITLNDLYPESHTYLQVYKGAPALGTAGRMVPGSSLVIRREVPEDRTLIVEDYDAMFESDGVWTMELLTVTPFGVDRLAYIPVEIDRTIHVNATVSTYE